jgi:hypothetical protein
MNWLKAHWKYVVLVVALLSVGTHAYQAFRGGASVAEVTSAALEELLQVQWDQALFEATAPDAAQGWVSDPDEVATVVAEMIGPRVFGDTPAGKIQEIPPQVFGWQRHETLFARPPPVKNQGQVGSCVANGTGTAIERTLAGEIVRRKGTSAEWTRFVEEATYGISRNDIGGGKIRGDGSVGIWAAKGATTIGMLPRKKYPSRDLTEYSESLCRQWGSSSGVPAEFKTEARKFPVKSFTQAKVWEEAKAAIAQDYYIAVCSNQGFTMQRDSRGVCRPSGSWAHCMAIDGYVIDTDGKEYGHIVNSWGPNAHTGPVGWGNPGPDGFWADASVIDRMLKQGDSWAFSGVVGFPARRVIDWNVRAQQRRDLFALKPEVSLSW